MKRVELKNDCYKEIYYYNEYNLKYNIIYYNSSGKPHKLGGPASIWYNESKEIVSKYYWINGKHYSYKTYNKQPEVIKYRKKLKITK